MFDYENLSGGGGGSSYEGGGGGGGSSGSGGGSPGSGSPPLYNGSRGIAVRKPDAAGRNLPKFNGLRLALVQNCSGILVHESQIRAQNVISGTVDAEAQAIGFANCRDSRFQGGGVECRANAECRRRGLLATTIKEDGTTVVTLTFSGSRAASLAVPVEGCDGSTLVRLRMTADAQADAGDGEKNRLQKRIENGVEESAGLYPGNSAFTVHKAPEAEAYAFGMESAAHMRGKNLRTAVAASARASADNAGRRMETEESGALFRITDSFIN